MGEGIYSLDRFLDEAPLPKSMRHRSEMANGIMIPVMRWNHQRTNPDRTKEYWSLREKLFVQLFGIVDTSCIERDYTWQRPGLRNWEKRTIHADFVVTYEDARVCYATAFHVEPGLAVDRMNIARRKLNGWAVNAREEFKCIQTATVFAFSDGLHTDWWTYDEHREKWEYSDDVHPPRYTFIEPTTK